MTNKPISEKTTFNMSISNIIYGITLTAALITAGYSYKNSTVNAINAVDSKTSKANVKMDWVFANKQQAHIDGK